MRNDVRVFATLEGAWSLNSIALHIGHRGSQLSVAKEVVFEEVAEGSYVDPALRLTPTGGQELMDSLWQCGVRPSEGTGSAGSLAAVERHLKDMQRIVFGSLPLKKPRG